MNRFMIHRPSLRLDQWTSSFALRLLFLPSPLRVEEPECIIAGVQHAAAPRLFLLPPPLPHPLHPPPPHLPPPSLNTKTMVWRGRVMTNCVATGIRTRRAVQRQ